MDTLVQVLRQGGDKEMLEMEALSLVILELNFTTQPRTETVQVAVGCRTILGLNHGTNIK